MAAFPEQIFTGYYFVGEDYPAVEYFSDPDDAETGTLVCFVNAGDSVLDVVRKIASYERNRRRASE